MARILFVNKASMFYPGGAETRIRAVATAWAKAGHEVFLICAKTRPGEIGEEVVDGVVIRRLSVMPEALLSYFPVPHYFPQALFYVISLPYIVFYVRKWRISLIRDSMSPFPGLGALAPWLGRRAVVVVHILYGGYGSWRKFYPALYALLGAMAEGLLLRGWLAYRAIITDSTWLAEYIEEKGKKELEVHAIENGIETARIPIRAARREMRRLMNASRFVEHKGQFDLVNACGQLRDAGISFTLHLFGEGPLKAQLENRVMDLRLGEFISIFPPLPHEQILRRFCEYDLYVMTSHSEGLPVVLLEAMAAQIPIIVPARGYATTLLPKEVAYFYDAAEPQSLAQTIAWVLQHPAEVQRTAEGGREFISRFTWERTAKLELAQLEQIQEGRN